MIYGDYYTDPDDDETLTCDDSPVIALAAISAGIMLALLSAVLAGAAGVARALVKAVHR